MLGGPEVSYDAEDFLTANPHIDGILRGEGEAAFHRLCERLLAADTAAADDPSGRGAADPLIRGVCRGLSSVVWRDGVLIRDNGPERRWKWQNCHFRIFIPAADKVVYYESSRGCLTGAATVCPRWRKTIRPMPLERTLSELAWFLDRGRKTGQVHRQDL